MCVTSMSTGLLLGSTRVYRRQKIDGAFKTVINEGWCHAVKTYSTQTEDIVSAPQCRDVCLGFRVGYQGS